MSEQQPPTPEQPTTGQPPTGQPPTGQPPPAPPYGEPPAPSPPSQQPTAPPPAYQQPTAPPPAYQPPAAMTPSDERTWGALAHFGAFLLGFLAPLLVYVIYKDRSQWVAAQSKEALNFNISYLIYLLASAATMLLLIGFILFPVVFVAYYVFMIVGGVKALNGEVYRFPLILRLIS